MEGAAAVRASASLGTRFGGWCALRVGGDGGGAGAAAGESWRWAGGGFRRASKGRVARGILLRSLREATPTHTRGYLGRVLCVRGWLAGRAARLLIPSLYSIDDRSKRRRIIRNTLLGPPTHGRAGSAQWF